MKKISLAIFLYIFPVISSASEMSTKEACEYLKHAGEMVNKKTPIMVAPELMLVQNLTEYRNGICEIKNTLEINTNSLYNSIMDIDFSEKPESDHFFLNDDNINKLNGLMLGSLKKTTSNNNRFYKISNIIVVNEMNYDIEGVEPIELITSDTTK